MLAAAAGETAFDPRLYPDLPDVKLLECRAPREPEVRGALAFTTSQPTDYFLSSTIS
jgi:hypothetical protein